MGQKAVTLPVPMVNILNGGRHVAGGTDFQEFMIVPLGAATFSQGIRWAAEIFHALGAVLHERGLPTAVGDEGGYGPALATNESAVELVMEAIQRAGYRPGAQVALGARSSRERAVRRSGLPARQRGPDADHR